MTMKLRQPDRRRFRSPIREKRRREREYYYAAVSVLVVKIILFVFLAVLFNVSVRLFHFRFQHLSPPVRYMVPTLVGLAAIALIYFIVKNIKDLRELSAQRRSGGK
jgi:H+/Cl- antiporter ClcA